ncbi:hypothetical protein HNO88_003719 [Novosphingobium chloroacetimidivorans]|uniref:Uncharacterized protein n=1 Tax=Novosphingobium chloroacetimidivorans TaxID=1428314 RepID=A0A7W7NXH3_9SPHN|nr:hypothetical protein [Novosphingobium chloroacetimidivorans]MBB4860376.1 hypothetical protein [Novosphingobium chloroacetimidivorans]
MLAAASSVALAGGNSAAEPSETAPTIAAQLAAPVPAQQLLPVGTPVRLMVLREITSRNAHPGDRFELRVDEPIFINGQVAVPVGTRAWGEVISVKANGAVGNAGRLAARPMYLDLPQGRVALRGSLSEHGQGYGPGVAMAVVGFGIFGLLTAGDSARLKGGQSFTAYVDAAPGT